MSVASSEIDRCSITSHLCPVALSTSIGATYEPQSIKPTALVLNILVSLVVSWRLVRGHCHVAEMVG